jgi:hypothetical protein
MLEHWIQPLVHSFSQEEYQSGDRIGRNLTAVNAGNVPPKGRGVALIGADSRWTKHVRRHLYKFTHRMSDIGVYDLGNLRRTDPDFVTGPVHELMSSGVCPVIIGGHASLIKAVRQGFIVQRKPFRPVLMHESIPDHLSDIPDKTTVIGVQQHLVPKQLPEHVRTMHLSHTRATLSDADTHIRESNCTLFDLSAMSATDVPSQRSLSTSGLNIEEGCLLMRSAGLHAQTNAVLITGHDPMSLQLDQSANVVAQMIWYFLEAYNQCIYEHPLESSHCTTYAMHLDDYDTDLKFYKSEKTGRWWVQFLPINL